MKIKDTEKKSQTSGFAFNSYANELSIRVVSPNNQLHTAVLNVQCLYVGTKQFVSGKPCNETKTANRDCVELVQFSVVGQT